MVYNLYDRIFKTMHLSCGLLDFNLPSHEGFEGDESDRFKMRPDYLTFGFQYGSIMFRPFLIDLILLYHEYNMD